MNLAKQLRISFMIIIFSQSPFTYHNGELGVPDRPRGCHSDLTCAEHGVPKKTARARWPRSD